jgi:hypothetical protein
MEAVFHSGPVGHRLHTAVRVQFIGKQFCFLLNPTVHQVAVPVRRADCRYGNLYGHPQVSIIFAVVLNGRVFVDLHARIHVFRLFHTQSVRGRGIGRGGVGGSGVGAVRAFPVPIPLI